jgi:hypothetical protein
MIITRNSAIYIKFAIPLQCVWKRIGFHTLYISNYSQLIMQKSMETGQMKDILILFQPRKWYVNGGIKRKDYRNQTRTDMLFVCMLQHGLK